jgi:hypothetical protein
MRKIFVSFCLFLTLCLTVSAASITVVMPNGGENLVKGVKTPVIWKYSGISDTALVRVSLLYKGSEIGEIANNVPIKYSLSPSGNGALPDKWVAGEYKGGSAAVDCKYKIRLKVVGT